MKLWRRKIIATLALAYLGFVIVQSARRAAWANFKAGVRGVWSIR